MTGLAASLLTAILSLFLGLFALALQAAVMISGPRYKGRETSCGQRRCEE